MKNWDSVELIAFIFPATMLLLTLGMIRCRKQELRMSRRFRQSAHARC